MKATPRQIVTTIGADLGQVGAVVHRRERHPRTEQSIVVYRGTLAIDSLGQQQVADWMAAHGCTVTEKISSPHDDYQLWFARRKTGKGNIRISIGFPPPRESEEWHPDDRVSLTMVDLGIQVAAYWE